MTKEITVPTYVMTDDERIEIAWRDLESAREEFERGFYSAAEGILRRVLDDVSIVNDGKYKSEKKEIEDLADEYLTYSVEYDAFP